MVDENCFLTAGVTQGQLNALVKKLGGLQVMDDILTGKIKFELVKPSLLEVLDRVEITANPAQGPFSKKDLNIVGSNDRFDDEILSQMGQVSESMTARQHKLLETSVDVPILVELGVGDDPSTIALSAGQFRVWLQTAEHRWHVLYIQGKTEVWAVDVDWHGDGWYCRAYSTSNVASWSQGRVLVFR